MDISTKIQEKILDTWPDWSKVLFQQVVLGVIWLAFGMVLAESKINYLTGFEHIFSQFQEVMDKTLRIVSFLLVPFSLYFWAHSYLVIVCSKGKNLNYKSLVLLVVQNFFSLWFTWYLAYNPLTCNYKLLGVLQEGGKGKIHIWLVIYLMSIIVYVLIRNSSKVIMQKLSKMLVAALTLFYIYFLIETGIKTYLVATLKLFFK